MDLDAQLRPWIELLYDQAGGLDLFDAHTHIGQNDPDGRSSTVQELTAGLGAAGARGAFVFPMHEPDGYPPANDAVIAAAQASGGLLVPFCRVDPAAGAVAETERCLAAGARGIKLHPRAEQFRLADPAVRELVALADEHRLPVLIHAGRGIPALGADALALASEFPDARLILAHAGICDLSWIWRAAADHPNLLFDTAWWMPADLAALFSLVAPGQILFASDAPYGTTLIAAAFMLRTALQAGLSPEQLRSVAGGQALRIAAGEALVPCGPALGERDQAAHLLLDRAADFLLLGAIATIQGGDGSEMLALARLACDAPDDVDDAPVFAAVRGLLEAYDATVAANPTDIRAIALLILALTASRTPDVPVPRPR